MDKEKITKKANELNMTVEEYEKLRNSAIKTRESNDRFEASKGEGKFIKE